MASVNDAETMSSTTMIVTGKTGEHKQGYNR